MPYPAAAAPWEDQLTAAWASEGLSFLGDQGWLFLEEEGCVRIADWEEGQRQRKVAVVQFGARIA
jgi:hypothetical protein